MWNCFAIQSKWESRAFIDYIWFRQQNDYLILNVDCGIGYILSTAATYANGTEAEANKPVLVAIFKVSSIQVTSLTCTNG